MELTAQVERRRCSYAARRLGAKATMIKEMPIEVVYMQAFSAV